MDRSLGRSSPLKYCGIKCVTHDGGDGPDDDVGLLDHQMKCKLQENISESSHSSLTDLPDGFHLLLFCSVVKQVTDIAF
jgi:hypothetical protein